MNPQSPHRRLLSSRAWRIGLAALIVGALAVAYWIAVRSSPDALEPNTKTDTPVVDGSPETLPPELARIFAESNEVLREHLLANWVATHTLDQIVEQLRGLSEEQRLPVATLAVLKIRDIDTDSLGFLESRKLLRQHAALYRDNPAAFVATSLVDSLIEQADVDPLATFHRLATVRMASEDREKVQEQIIDVVSTKAPQRALALLAQMRGIPRISALGTIAENWTRLDPVAAFAWARQQPRSANTLYVVLREWSRRDPAAALEAATALPASQADQFDMKELLSSWLADSPAESIAWLKTVSNPDPQLITAAVESLGKSNPQLAQSLLAHPLPASLRTELTEHLAREWAKADPTAALRWVQTLPKDRAYNAAMETVFSHLIDQDVSAALALYRSLPEGSALSSVGGSIAWNLPAHEALTWLLSLPSSSQLDSVFGPTLMRPEFSSSAQLHAALALIPPGPALDRARSLATARQLGENPAGLTDWLRALPDNDARAQALQFNCWSWAEKDPSAAKAYALELGSGPAFDALVSGIESSMTRTDPGAAVEWLLSLPISEGTCQALDDAFNALARKAPTTAIDKVRALPAGETRSAALKGLIDGLPSAQAAEMLFALATPAEQLEHVGALARGYQFNTTPEAAAWLQSLPSGPVRDAGLSGAAHQLAASDPAAPLSLLPLATSDDARFELASAALLALHHRDEQAARDALARLRLSPDVLKRLEAELNAHSVR